MRESKAGTSGRSPSPNGGSGVSRERVVWDVAHLLVSESSPERVLEVVGDALAELVPYDNLTIYEADAPLRLLRPVVCRDVYAEEILAAGPLPYGSGITGTAVERREPALVNDAHLDPRAVQVPGTPDEAESLVAVPLIARGEPKGALCLSRLGEGARFTDREFDLTIRFGELAALAIDNAETRARLETEAVTDHLTGLRNHRYFHERLGEEVRRTSRNQTKVGLLLYDIDDFKRVNDCFGHLLGDQVLQGVATISREACRAEDVLCRIGGEEFAVILPGSGLEEAATLAERLRGRLAATSFPVAGRLTISVGVAAGPLHASSPRDLTACADLALLEAKTEGKDLVRVYDANAFHEPDGSPGPSRGELRSVAHVKMLQSLTAKLNRLNDVKEIGAVITAELRGLIDYHNCRVYLLEEDGETLEPIAFLGDLLEYQGETRDALLTKVGEGFTGHVAETGESLYLPDASAFEKAVQIPGTPEIDESILAVPLCHGDRITGVIVLSKLGLDQFDRDDMRLLEVAASNAAVALENARLLHVEREAAEISGALLELSEVLTRARDTGSVMEKALAAIPPMLGCSQVQAWVRDPETGAMRAVRHQGFEGPAADRLDHMEVPREVAERFMVSVTEPFVLSNDVLATVPREYQPDPEGTVRAVLVAPLRWEPDGLGAIVSMAPSPRATFSHRQVRLARGIADIASLALGNATAFDELERAYFSTIEALANALEAQDEYTGDHARSLAEMALAVGQAYGFAGEDLKRLELAALFHDIGKIGVPSEIIRKPGPLTDKERYEINQHPEIGEEILEPVPFLRPVRSIVRACHERWDGKGYPDGLAGEEIPLEARIVFVCDAYHAMTTNRPYRAAIPEEEAIRRLKLAAGTQFDPHVVDTFVQLHAAGKVHSHEAA